MTEPKKIINQIKQQGLLPLFYHEDADVCYGVMNALYKAGIRIVEFTNRGENANDNFEMLLKKRDTEWPDMLLAIGTIKNIDDANAYIALGADIIISPGIVKEVGHSAQHANRLWIPGCMTPSEIILAESCRANLVKLFPGNLLGPEFISSIKSIFPSMNFMPTGGVNIEATNLKAWFGAGACAVGIGSKLISKSILANKNYNKLTQLTKEAITIITNIIENKN